MHAILCQRHGPPEVMRYDEVPRPEPAAGEVLINAEAIGVNFVDTMRRSGKHPSAPQPPFTPGIELVGRVVSVGAGVQRFREGDRAIGRCVTHGAYAECVAVEERFAVACTDDVQPKDAAALFVNGQTAYHALITLGHVQLGETVLVTAAAGGVGTCAVQIAKRLGARVVALAGSEEKLALVRRLGADFAINYSLNDWPQQVLDATDGKGAELVLESVGGEVAQGCLRCWAPGGRLVVFGKASGQPVTVTTNELLFGNRSAYGLAVGTLIEDETLMREAMDRLYKWLSDGSLRLIIGATFPLRGAAEAHRQLESRKTYGKIILIP